MKCKYFGYMFVGEKCASCETCDSVDECLESSKGNWKVVSYSFKLDRCVDNSLIS